MNAYVAVLLGTGITFAATVFGAATVFLFKKGVNPNFQRAFLGFAAGVMIAASIFSLILPATEMAAADFEGEGKGVLTLIKELGLVPSNGEGRRTVEQGGLSINGEKVTDPKTMVTLDMFKDGEMVIQKGKKKFHKVIIK